MKLGFIGLGNMAGTICQGVIESGFIKGEDVCGFDINQDKLTQMEKDYGMCVCTIFLQRCVLYGSYELQPRTRA